MRSGRTIGERREQLETASERAASHKKIKTKKRARVFFTVVLFALFIAVAAYLIYSFLQNDGSVQTTSNTIILPYSPTIEIIDEDSTITGGDITSRMKEFIGQTEADLRALGYVPTKAVIPSGSIREVDFYLDSYNGFIKTTIDRGSGVSAEDTDRMIKYLAGIGVNDFTYIDVRIPRKAFWK